MTAVDKRSAESQVALWRDPVWLGVVAIFVITSAVVIGAIAGRATAVIDVWALAVGGVAAASVAAASVAIAAWRQQTGARATVSYEVFLQTMPHASAIIDNTGRAQPANDKFQQLFPDAQHAPLTALKRRIGDGIGNGSAASDLIGRLIVEAASGSAATVDIEIVDDGDGIEGLCVSALPLADQSGLALWTFEDITAQRSAAAEVREFQANLTEAITAAPIGFFSVDQDGRFLLVNDALASWLGYEPGAIEQQSLRLHDILVEPSPQTAAYRVAGTKDAEADGAEQEVALRRRDGDPLPVVVSQAENRGEDGRLRTSSVVRQLVVEHGAQPSLIRSEHRFERMFENAPVGVVLLDDRGRVVEANNAWQMLVAPGEENLTGRSITEFVADDSAGDMETWIERVADVTAPVTPQDVTLRTKTTTDASRIATMYYSRMEGARGAGGLIVHFHEATEQRSLEEQFAQSQKMQAVGQ